MSIRFPVELISALPLPVAEPAHVSPSITGSVDGTRHDDPIYEAVNKKIPLARAVVQPPVLEANTHIDQYLKAHASDLMTPEAEVSKMLRNKIVQRWGKDIDPDTTYLVTFDGGARAQENVVEKLTLTQAALKNSQDVPIKNDEGWFERIGKFFSLPVFIYNKIEEAVKQSHAQQGIYQAPVPPHSIPYSAATSVDIPVADFKQLVWDTDRTALYENTLNTFWKEHSDAYVPMSRMSFLKAAKQQALDGSLTPEASKLALRVMGAFASKPWSELSVADFAKPSLQDSGLDIGMLSINGMQSTDLLSVVDKKTQLTLLYIPGNSSPLHTFDNPGQIPRWVAQQATDPVKLAALLGHFPLKDQATRVLFEGVRQTLEGLGGWYKAQQIEGFSFDKINDWVPERYVTGDSISGDPFREIFARQKARSFSDAKIAIVTDGDYRKNKVINVVEETAKIALFMTPLALVMPEVALALDAFYLAAGATEIGIGVDDAVKGKATGTDRIVFGALNAIPPLVVHGAGSLVRESEAVAHIRPSGAPERPSFNPPRRVNNQIGYPLGPVSPPKIAPTFKIPMDDIVVLDSSKYTVGMGGYSHPVIYDLEVGAWRGLNSRGEVTGTFYWRGEDGLWHSGTREVLARAENKALSVNNEIFTLPVLPALPSNSSEVPKVIHYFWAGNEMPDHLLSNIIENSRKSPGYKSIVHVDANNEAVYLKVKAALDHRVGGLEVQDLNMDPAFIKFNESQQGDLYRYFRAGHSQNLAASSDVMRLVVMKEYGGIYLDTDDVLAHAVGQVSMKAAPGDILLSGQVTYAAADFKGFNTSNFASQPGNPLFGDVLDEMYQRFNGNKEWLDANRPLLRDNATQEELEAFKAYEKKIFEVTGPVALNDVLKRLKSDHFALVDAETELQGNKLIAPAAFRQKLIKLKKYFTAMEDEFGVKIGAEHSMRHSR